MPEFCEDLSLVWQHRMIHQGLEEFEDYANSCRTGETELRLGHMKMLMDSFAEALWTHLDDEVKALGAENEEVLEIEGNGSIIPLGKQISAQ